MGVRNYTSLLDIPEPIDLAIVAVPRSVVPGVLKDCIRRMCGCPSFYRGLRRDDTEEG